MRTIPKFEVHPETGETFDQFCERMSNVEKEDEFEFGRSCDGCSRAIFTFESEMCFLESFGFHPVDRNLHPVHRCLRAVYHPPTSHWLHARLIYGKTRAEKIQEFYGAKCIEEDPYPREANVWFSLVFEKFEDLMKIVWDIYTTRFITIFGEEPKKYESCIGYLEEK